MNPYEVKASDSSLATTGKLVCPYCEHAFSLTWSRYWMCPTGNHRCPTCGNRGHLKYTATYLLQVGFTTLYAMTIALALAYIISFWLDNSAFVTIPVALIFVFVMDRHFDKSRPYVRRDLPVARNDATKPAVQRLPGV